VVFAGMVMAASPIGSTARCSRASISASNTRYVAPVIEELLKALVIVALIARSASASSSTPRSSLRRRHGLPWSRTSNWRSARRPGSAPGSCAASHRES